MIPLDLHTKLWEGIRTRILSTPKVCVGPLWRNTGVIEWRGEPSLVQPPPGEFFQIGSWCELGNTGHLTDVRVGSRKKSVTWS